MRKKIIISFNLIFVMFLTIWYTSSLAETQINLLPSKYSVNLDEEFSITVDVDNANIAACTIWIYFDNDKVEYISSNDTTNVVDNRIIYTWISAAGTNEILDELLQIEFKARQNGIASFSVVGEFYNQKGEQIDIKYNQVDVGVGEDNLIKIQNEEVENSNEEVSDDNAKLKIMRLNQEGVNPKFDPNITEYYLTVDENINKLDIIAIPENGDAEIKITGNEDLKSGVNQINISVTSKDKTNTEEYIINVTKTNNVKTANADLETLAVEYYTLSPEYQNTVTNYSLQVSNTTEKLNILAIPQNESAIVHISGNENLKIGQNQVVVTVTASNGITNKKYIIDVYRRNEEEEIQNAEEQQNMIQEVNEVLENLNDEEVINEENENKNTIENHIFMIVGIVLSIIVIGIVFIRIRKRK